MDAGRLLEMEITLSVNDVGILANVPEGAPNQTTGLYRLESAVIFLTWQLSIVFVGLMSALIICTRIIWHLIKLILNSKHVFKDADQEEYSQRTLEVSGICLLIVLVCC